MRKVTYRTVVTIDGVEHDLTPPDRYLDGRLHTGYDFSAEDCSDLVNRLIKNQTIEDTTEEILTLVYQKVINY